MRKTERVNEKLVAYESTERNIAYGIKYLDNTLLPAQSKEIFSKARERGSAEFKDGQGRKFFLLYVSGNYVLTAQK